jgi:hypothetical protein
MAAQECAISVMPMSNNLSPAPLSDDGLALQAIRRVQTTKIRYRGKLVARLEELLRAYQEDYEGHSLSARAIDALAMFLSANLHLRRPRVTATPSGDLYAEWTGPADLLLGVRVTESGQTQFVIFCTQRPAQGPHRPDVRDNHCGHADGEASASGRSRVAHGMKGDLIPDLHHVSRLCGGSHIDDGVVQAGAFPLAPSHSYLSVNWLEHLGLSDRAAELGEIQRVLATKRKVGTTARLAVAPVGEMRTLVRNESDDARELHVLHEPPDPSHAGIHH